MVGRINTVIFDFDGTIADTNDLIIDSWQAVYRARYGKEGDIGYILSTFGEPLYTSMQNAFPEFDVEDTVNIYREYQKEIFDSTIKAFPGITDLVKNLHDEGYKIGIVTSRLKPSTLRGSEVIGIKGYIDAFVTVEDTDKHKPDPEPALICLKKLGSTPNESIMVGDSDFDIGCGKSAGMETVMVGWSRASDEQRSCLPDYMIESPEDLYPILRK